MTTQYPVTFSVDYPDRPLNRLTTFFRLITAIPILIVLGTISSWSVNNYGTHNAHQIMTIAAGGGLLFFGPLLMIVFRQKYPRWWFDWNLELLRFNNRVGVYLALMDDRYPSTDRQQSVHLNIPYPNVQTELNRWLPLIKWILALPHYIVLFFLDIAALIAVIIVWFNIVFTGVYPKSMFEFIEGVFRWNLRVISYAFVLVTDVYPPFDLGSDKETQD